NKIINPAVHNALYSTGQERQEAIEELKSHNKNLIRYNLKKHGNEIRNEKSFGKYGGAINYIENKLGLNKLDNVGTVDDLPDAMMNKRREIEAEVEAIEKEIKDTLKKIIDIKK
ncbi:MAG: hypothetical protein KAQ92_08170, partial [Candidatus Aenigmarchaeota archaeon]|nr:hypothetical protein [Candidatus Aenigmarchaeota archaeon]